MQDQAASIVDRGKVRYYELRPLLEKKYEPEDYITIDVDSGDYFVAKTGLDAIKKAQRKYPSNKFFLAQVGRIAGLLKWMSI